MSHVTTYAQAADIARPHGEALWAASEHPGTYQIEPTGYEDATKYLIVDGAAEVEQDPELYTPMDKICLFVLKANGVIVEATGLAAAEALDNMTETRP